MDAYMMSLAVSAAIAIAALLLCLAAEHGLRRFRRRIKAEGGPGVAGASALLRLGRLRRQARASLVSLVAAPILIAAGAAAARQARFMRIEETTLVALIPTAVLVPGYLLFRVMKSRQRAKLAQTVHGDQVTTGRALAPLADQGCLLYHDIRHELLEADHVIVGSKGVFIVCVHTPRARPADRSGGAEATVSYDGRALLFERRVDYDTITQANMKADSLSALVSRALNQPVAARAVVCMPGWTVRRTSAQGISVVNPRQFASFFEHIAPRPLTGPHIALIDSLLRRLAGLPPVC